MPESSYGVVEASTQTRTTTCRSGGPSAAEIAPNDTSLEVSLHEPSGARCPTRVPPPIGGTTWPLRHGREGGTRGTNDTEHAGQQARRNTKTGEPATGGAGAR